MDWLLGTGGFVLLLVVILIVVRRIAPTNQGKRALVVRTPAPELLQREAQTALSQLVDARRNLERRAVEVQAAIQQGSARHEFRRLRHLHAVSRETADSWYQHKATALASRKRLSAGLATYRERKRQLAQQRDRSRGSARAHVEAELGSAQVVIDHHYRLLKQIADEVDGGSEMLTRFNINTGRLRDLIRDHCGEDGRQWYEALQRRTRQRQVQRGKR